MKVSPFSMTIWPSINFLFSGPLKPDKDRMSVMSLGNLTCIKAITWLVDGVWHNYKYLMGECSFGLHWVGRLFLAPGRVPGSYACGVVPRTTWLLRGRRGMRLAHEGNETSKSGHVGLMWVFFARTWAVTWLQGGWEKHLCRLPPRELQGLPGRWNA